MSRVLLFSCLLPLLTLAQGDNSQQGGGDNPQSPSDAGATGTQTGAFSLSTGAVVAIAVIASIVVVVGGKHESVCLYRSNSMLIMSKLAQRSCFGSRKSDNGTFGNLFVVPLVVSLAAQQPTQTRKIATTGEQAFDSTHHHPGKKLAAGKIRNSMLRRVCPCQRQLRQSQA